MNTSVPNNAMHTPPTERLGHSREPSAPAPDLETALNTALASPGYLIAVWHLADGRIHLFRELASFPRDDFSRAQDLLRDDLARISEP